MAIDIEQLKQRLLEMSVEETPGREFCRAISELAPSGRFKLLRDALPGIVYDELWERYRQNPSAFVAGWRMLAQVEPAVERATYLRECVVAAPSSEEADRYLDEATRCYFFGLFTACAVMCRSVLEEAIKQKLPAQLARLVRTRYPNAATLGNLLHEVNNNLQLTRIDADFPRVANQVNDTGKKAVHQGLLAEDEARICL